MSELKSQRSQMVDAKTGQGFKTDIFNGQYDAELEQIPVYMRERVAFLIE